MTKQRDGFIDIIKIYACILVVLGHFFMSMEASSIIKEVIFIEWFEKTIYYFHVPLFFICSGYLHQKYSSINTLADYGNNIRKKSLSLLIPYIVFLSITWLLKVVFSSSVNAEVNGYFYSLFCEPISPYWYLYALFFIFLITPTAKSQKNMFFMLFFALIMKSITFLPFDISLYPIKTLFMNEIWFVIGMSLSFCNLQKLCRNKVVLATSFLLLVCFVFISVAMCLFDISYAWLEFVMGIVACFTTIVFVINIENNSIIKRFDLLCSKYTFPVFLMHTIFAAGIRAVLFKLGIDSAFIHIICGLSITFIGPVIAYEIMSRIKILDFLLYPNKYLKASSRRMKNV